MQKVSEKINDETPFAITLKPLTSLENHTGAWRTLKPAYNFHEPPCSATCPAGERCRDWLFLAEDGGYEAARRKIMEDNPCRDGPCLLPHVRNRL